MDGVVSIPIGNVQCFDTGAFEFTLLYDQCEWLDGGTVWVRRRLEYNGLTLEILERPEQLVRSVVIPRLHPSLWENVADATRFSARVLEKL